MTWRMNAPLLALALGVSLTAAQCGDRDRAALVGGEVTGDSTAYRALDYELTSDKYRKWSIAQHALDSIGIDDTIRLNVRNVGDDDVTRVVQSLQSRPEAKLAIERADLSVRDFVLTTIALAQSWDAINRPSVSISGLRSENVDFLRRQTTLDPVLRSRPRARFLDDDDSDHGDSDGDSDSEGKRGSGKRDRDGDGDSDKGRGKDKRKG